MEEFKSAIHWFEIPANNFARAVRFYSEIYAFEMQTREMGHVKMGFFKHQQGGGIGGAVISGDGCVPSQTGPRLYLSGGNDLLVVLNRVEAAGGTVILGKTEIAPEIGHYAIIVDTEGNRIYLHSMN